MEDLIIPIPKHFLTAIILVSYVLQFLKKLLEKSILKWILKIFFKISEVPHWLNFIIVNGLAFIIFAFPLLADKVLTLQEIIMIVEYLIGINMTFKLYKKVTERQ